MGDEDGYFKFDDDHWHNCSTARKARLFLPIDNDRYYAVMDDAKNDAKKVTSINQPANWFSNETLHATCNSSNGLLFLISPSEDTDPSFGHTKFAPEPNFGVSY